MNSGKFANNSNSFNLKYHTLSKNNHNNNKLLKSIIRKIIICFGNQFTFNI